MTEQLSIAIYSGMGVAAVAAIKEVVMWLLNRRAKMQDAKAETYDKTVEDKIDQLHNEVTLMSANMTAFGEAQKRQDRGLVEMLSYNIEHLCGKYISRDEICASELAALERMYEAYHALGGNGYLTHLVERVRSLPITPG